MFSELHERLQVVPQLVGGRWTLQPTAQPTAATPSYTFAVFYKYRVAMALIYDPGSQVRLRIAEIEIRPVLSERAIKLELMVDGNLTKKLPEIHGGQPLKWSKLIICDVRSESQVELVIHQKCYTLYPRYKRYKSESYRASEVIQSSVGSFSINVENIEYNVKLKLLDQTRAKELFDESEGILSCLGETRNASNGPTATQTMFKSMLQFGSLVHPIAKLVFSVCTYAWERFETEQKLRLELDDLAGQLLGMTRLVERVKECARLEPLIQTIGDFLHLLEDVSIFVLERKAKGFVVQVLKGVIDSGDRDQVEDLGKRFQRISSIFEKGIGAQTMKIVTTAREDELLQRLNPVRPSGHNPSWVCQEGTRRRVLGDIDRWIRDEDSTHKLMWIYGQAGIGKSTVATSVCQELSDKGILVVSFFCKRDDSALRDPLRLINSVAHGLTIHYPPYGKLVAQEIETNKDLCTSYLQTRYLGLLKKPLCALDSAYSPPPCVIIIDAMDECGTEDTRTQQDATRKQVLGYLLDLSSLVPWLKVIVTSRPDSNIRVVFEQSAGQLISQIDLHGYSAVDDIQIFIKAKLNDIANRDEWPSDGIERICKKAGGLFIWAATACAFIIEADDPPEQLRILFEENVSGNGFDGLDSLYTTVIKNALGNSVPNIQRCIGSIVTISMRQPVPFEVLSKLMERHIKLTVLERIIERLGAVFYRDAHLKEAIRVIHPSFADFVLDKDRSKSFWIDPIQRNIEISIGCVSIMEDELRFNICDLETSHLPNGSVSDLNSKIEDNVSGQLAYSCIYWIDHLLGSRERFIEVANLAAKITQAGQPLLLYWLEVLSVLQKVPVATYGLRELSRKLRLYQQASAKSVWDAYRFVFAFSDPIIMSAPHIYISALPLAPKQSEISRRFLDQFRNTARIVNGQIETWPVWLRSLRHPEQITSLCISQDGQWLLTSCLDDSNPIRVFDMRTGELVRTLKQYSPTHESRFVAISPDGALIASASMTGEILFWNANSGAVVHSHQIEIPEHDYFSPRAWSFLPDGSALRILTGGVELGHSAPPLAYEIGINGVVEAPRQIGEGGLEYRTLALSPDGTCIAGRTSRELVILTWPDPPAGGVRLDIDGGDFAIVFSPSGNLIAAGGDRLQIFHAKAGSLRGAKLSEGCYSRTIQHIAFSSDETQLITANETARTHVVRAHVRAREILIWETQTCRNIGIIPIGHSFIDRAALAFSPNGAHVVSALSGNTVLICDVSVATLIDRSYPFAKQRTGLVSTSLLRRDGTPTADSDSGYSDRPQNHEHGVQLAGPSGPVTTVAFSPDSNRIISVSSDAGKSTVQTWNTHTGAPIGEPFISDSHIDGFTFSPDGTRIIVQVNNRYNTFPEPIDVWDANTYEPLMQLKMASHPFALSPDGSHLVTNSQESDDDGIAVGGLILWDFSTGDIIQKLDATRTFAELIAFSSEFEQSRMFSCHTIQSDDDSKDEKQVIIWNVAPYNIVGSWSLQDVYFNAFSLDGSSIGLHSYSSDGYWSRENYVVNNAQTGNQISSWALHRYSGRVVLSPDGTRLAETYRRHKGRGGSSFLTLSDSKQDVNYSLVGNSDNICSLAFSPDGTKLASGSEDKLICVWDVTGSDARGSWYSSERSDWPSNTRLFPPSPDGFLTTQKESSSGYGSQNIIGTLPTAVYCNIFQQTPSAKSVDFSRFAHGTDWAKVSTEYDQQVHT
ncbi:Vegetative incompatibility protein HET-E-1 [Rhizoctonia solani]|uniref:Vegetative incompatibility protein HET-E-1 n=1 Tax=Rhizoctonia solani TaxID=456999 RepID=A0A8H8NSM4_9AGAM|nr:Vegetative incompatibility protein HET-E-1 [Rhizoctonia solani]QRW18775.1 Vegetative incompatibility protein HET-E-1 [Rhizoctonia solani]